MDPVLAMSLETAQIAVRTSVTTLLVTGTLIGSIALTEDYRETAMIPVKGDKPTVGYGTTQGVKMGDRMTPARALIRLLDEVENVYARGVRACVTVPLYQHEYEAYVHLTYNIGVTAFCRHAQPGKPPNLIDLINAGRYEEACARIEAFNHGPSPGVDAKGNKIKGPVLAGLVKRRKAERAWCEGKADGLAELSARR